MAQHRVRNDRKGTLDERFWMRVAKDTACWNWIGAIDGDGYGTFGHQCQVYRAHRLSYEMAYGDIPKGLEIDHLCRNRRCVNPQHLEAVTKRVNVLRGRGRATANTTKTHCRYGHPLLGTNLAQIRGERICKTCRAETWKRYRLRKLQHDPDWDKRRRAV